MIRSSMPSGSLHEPFKCQCITVFGHVLFRIVVLYDRHDSGENLELIKKINKNLQKNNLCRGKMVLMISTLITYLNVVGRRRECVLMIDRLNWVP